jgi:ELP3 family radical SAM enzyme/protein acetyltransferase
MTDDIENITKSSPISSIDSDVSTELEDFVQELISSSSDDIDDISKKLRRKYQVYPSKKDIHKIYKDKFSSIKITPKMRRWMVKKQMRSNSGVLVVTIVLAPNKFSCKYDCAYCPQETDMDGKPTQPRSYLSNEPAMLRALESNFDVKGQFNSRIQSYSITGNIVAEQNSKIEVIFSGGTWESYPIEYREQVIRELYWAANTVSNERESKTLEEEITINETAQFRIIGFTLETRPDNVTEESIKDYRRWGVTRIQIGVQHYDDAILKMVNRKCYTKDTIKAIRLLKQAGMKVVVHLMPDLPGATPQIDYEMFKIILFDPRYQADQWKIYPTVVLAFTKIKEWYDNGTYKPYAETHFTQFLELLKWVQLNIPPWIRVNRIQRDFPGDHIEGGNKITNLRQVLDDELKKSTHKSQEIRSMEVKFNINHIHKARLVRIDYNGSDGNDIFLSHKSCNCKFCWKYEIYQMKKFILNFFNIQTYFYGCGNEEIIYSFLRLRISSPNYDNFFAESMRNKGKIRELHVYGDKVATYKQNKNKDLKTEHSGQHHGFGKKLLKVAEAISKDEYNCNGTCVIAGVGTRNYYRKQGYEIPFDEKNHGDFMVKQF